MINSKYKKFFIIEAEEKIAVLNSVFLNLEKEPDNIALANDAMRAVHTLKSSSSAMDFLKISSLCHAMENLLEQARTKKQSFTPQNIEVLFESVDALSASLKVIKNGEPEIDTAKLVEKLDLQLDFDKNENFLKAKSYQPTANIAPIEAIKVDIATLDKLMALTEELLVEKMRLSEITRKAKENPNTLISRAEIENSSESFERLISELQLNVSQARMVPLGQIFEQFPRIVRDLSYGQNKEADFQIIGQDIELDRTIIDRLGEPLIHLLRNAVDHGIEKIGKIKLNATRERDKVIIEVINEGKSIDWERVVEVAFNRGIINKEKESELTASLKAKSYKLRAEFEALLYQLSTKKTVTEISGRGVGLSIVKSVIESLGGTVSIESNVGETKFVLTLPLTIAIVQALLVRAINQTFALPFAQIDHSVRVSKHNIKKAFDQEVAVIDGKDVPIARLNKLFELEKKQLSIFLSEEEIEKKLIKQQDELVVIVKKENSVIAGIVIDELISEQDIVVKPLKGMLRNIKGFAGITLLGDGKPAMILDVTTLL